MKQGHIIVISGPSGVGKGTIVSGLLKQNPDLHFSVSATTRQKRPSEIDGVHYYFVSEERFKEMIENDELAEHAFYANHYYGTPFKALEEARAKGYDVVLDIEVQGAAQVKARFPEAVMVFIAPPSIAELERRLRNRGDTADADIALRLDIAKKECLQAERYNYIVFNDIVDDACREVQTIISAVNYEANNRFEHLKEVL